MSLSCRPAGETDDKIQLKAQFNTEGGAAEVQDEVPRQGKNLAAGMLFVQR